MICAFLAIKIRFKIFSEDSSLVFVPSNNPLNLSKFRYIYTILRVFRERYISSCMLSPAQHSECDNLCYLGILARNYLRSIRGILQYSPPPAAQPPPLTSLIKVECSTANLMFRCCSELINTPLFSRDQLQIMKISLSHHSIQNLWPLILLHIIHDT